ncbi:MAG: hypothetical protein ABJO27_14800 [Pseudoruegeria sp.]
MTHMPFMISAFCSALVLPTYLAAETPERVLEALQIQDILEVMRDEGFLYSKDLQSELFPGRGGVAWAADVEEIYDIDRMMESFSTTFSTQMPSQYLVESEDFFTSATGKKITSLEISARIAQMDEAIEEASKETLKEMINAEDPRLDLLKEFSDVNQLVEANVVGSLNANYAFYTGLIDAGAFGFEVTEDQILADVWQQEPEIRSDTEEWLFSYLALAYQPLEDADVQAYIDFSQTEAGTSLNRALFDSFDVMLVEISRALGLVSGKYMSGQDI